MSCVQQVAIVGGGIGGLTLAHALAEHGIRYRVYERGDLPGECGAGIGLWHNAFCVLDRVGRGQAVRALGRPIERVGAYTSGGERLRLFAARELIAGVADPVYVVLRSELHRVLVEGLDPSCLIGGRAVASIDDRGIHLADGTSTDAELIVGADGIHSVARKWVIDDGEPRYSGEVCWRGVVEPSGGCRTDLLEVQGEGRRFGMCPIDARRLYWWAAVDEARLAPSMTSPNLFEGLARTPAVDQLAFLRKQFDGWSLDVASILMAASADTIMAHRLVDRRPRRPWSRGRVTLLGDAAHPTTPNLGQGGCSAIEDAWVLARALATSSTLTNAQARYENERFTRCARIVKRSRQFGAIGRLGPGPTRGLVRMAAKLMPEMIAKRMVLNEISLDVTASV